MERISITTWKALFIKYRKCVLFSIQNSLSTVIILNISHKKKPFCHWRARWSLDLKRADILHRNSVSLSGSLSHSPSYIVLPRGILPSLEGYAKCSNKIRHIKILGTKTFLPLSHTPTHTNTHTHTHTHTRIYIYIYIYK